MKERFNRIVVGLLSVVMVCTLFCGTGFASQAATKKKLSAPSSFDYLWAGECLVIKWEPVKNAASYETQILGATHEAEDTCLVISRDWLTEKDGYYEISFKVRAKPKKNSSTYSASSYTTIKDSIPVVSYKNVHSYSSAMSLSKDDLLKWLALNGYKKYSETSEDGYTVITVSEKDNNNDDNWLNVNVTGLKAEVESVSLLDKLGLAVTGAAALLTDDKESFQGYLEYYDEKYAGIADQAAEEYKKTDKKKYYKYYYTEGAESLGAETMSISYLKNNNKSPKELFSEWEYDDTYGYYKEDTMFRDYKFMEYGTTGTGVGKRYMIVVNVYRPMAVVN